jgi:hypothetical protein
MSDANIDQLIEAQWDKLGKRFSAQRALIRGSVVEVEAELRAWELGLKLESEEDKARIAAAIEEQLTSTWRAFWDWEVEMGFE